MADLLPHKLLLHSLSLNSPRFPLFFSRSLNSSFSIIRSRRTRLFHSSSLLVNLSPDSARLDIISTSEQSDGSVVFKFGDINEISQNFENVNAGDAELEVVEDLNDEHTVNHTKSDALEAADGGRGVKLERESVIDEVQGSIDSKEEVDHGIEIEDSTDNKVDENDDIEVESSTNSKLEQEETVLKEFVDSCDSLTQLQSGAQPNGDSVEEEENHNIISTMEIENRNDSETMKRDLKTDSLAIVSDSSIDLSEENSCDSEMVNHGFGIHNISATSDSSADMVMERTEERRDGELVAAMWSSQLQLEVSELQEISKESSSVEASESAKSLGDRGIGGNVKHVVDDEEDNGNDMSKISDKNGSLAAADTALSLEDDELGSSVNHVATKEDADNEMQDMTEMNSLVEAIDKPVSLEDDELESYLRQVVIEEDDENKLVEFADLNLVTETSDNVEVANKEDTTLSLEDDEIHSNVMEAANEEYGDSKLRDVADVNSVVESPDNVVPLTDDELDSNTKKMVEEKEADDSEIPGIADVKSSIEVSDMAVSYEHDELDSSVQLVTNEEDSDDKVHEIAVINSLVEASDVAVALADSELESKENHLMNADDDWVELTEKPLQLESEPIRDEEASSDSRDNVLAEPTSDPNMVNNVAPTIIPLPEDDLFEGDLSQAASGQASGTILKEANADSGNSIAIVATPALCLSSAAASLPHPSEALTGGEDAYFVCQNWFGVADGVGQWSFEGTERGMYAQEFIQNCKMLASNQNAELTDFKEYLQQVAAMTKAAGSARVLIAQFANQALHVANIGDTAFVVIRNGVVYKKSTPMFHEFNFPYAIGSGIDPLEVVEEYHIDLEAGDVVVAATDGLFDNLYEQEIASIVSKSVGAGMEPKELAELLATKSQEVGSLAYGRSPFADAAQAAGHTGIVGGKLDHVTVVVSLVQIT